MKKILLFLLVGLLLLPSLVFADGGMFPLDNYYIYETGQKGAIIFADGQENLVLSTSFEGTAKDFSWIIPTPSQPEVTKVSKDIFTNLEELTRTEDVYTAKSQPIGLGMGGVAMNSVEVLEEKQIGYYDVTVLKSTDKNALYDWFNKHGYKYPEKGKYILDDYIRLGWIFTAVKITEDAQSDSTLQDKLNYGEIAPLSFKFASDKIVYPMKITGIAQFSEEVVALEKMSSEEQTEIYPYFANSMPVTLYIFADQKKELTGFYTYYANWEEPKTINNLATDEQGNSWANVNKKMYLTKLQSHMELTDMDEDLFPQNADDNTTIGVLSWWEKAFAWLMQFIGFIIVILLLMFFVPIYWQFKRASKSCHIISWISQIVSFIFIGALPLFYIIMITSGFFHYIGGWDFSAILIGLPYIVMPLMMLVLLIAEGVWQKKNIQRSIDN